MRRVSLVDDSSDKCQCLNANARNASLSTANPENRLCTKFAMGAIPSRFTYLPYAILLMILEVGLVLFLFHYFHKHERLRKESRAILERFSENIQSMFSTHSGLDLEASTNDNTSIIQHSVLDDYEKESIFTVDKACFGIGAYKINTYFLTCTRAANFSFFLAVDLVINMTSVKPHGSNWFYFTVWNAGLASGYYLFGLFFNILGIIYSIEVSDDLDSSSGGSYMKKKLSFPPGLKFNGYIQNLAYAYFTCYEVAGATAMMVTLVNFSFIDPLFYFMNVSLHFITTMSFLVEMSLNSQYVYMSHLPYNLAWVGMYIIVIIPVVTSNAVPDWPYSFMNTDTSFCFLWFTGLLFLNCFFYILWYIFHRFKFFLKNHHSCSRNNQDKNSGKYIYKSYLTNSLLSPEKYMNEQPNVSINTNNNKFLRTTSDSGEIFM